MSQQAFVLWFADDGNTNLSTLNALLNQGRRVVLTSAMSGKECNGGVSPAGWRNRSGNAAECIPVFTRRGHYERR